MSLFEKAIAEQNKRREQYLQQRRPQREKQSRFTWLTITEEKVTVTIRSPLEWWYSHFQPALRRSRRCPGATCKLCSEGMSVQLRFVLAVECEDGVVRLVELREKHAQIIEEINAAEKGQVGAKITIFKAWRAKNAPVLIELVGRTAVVPIELSRLVRSLGLEAIHCTGTTPEQSA